MIREYFLNQSSTALKQLQDEINAYTSEEKIWMKTGLISNSGGHLCLHLIGNLNHFVGFALGDTGYIRHRETEFTSTPVSSALLSQKIDDTISMIQRTITMMSDDDMDKIYPQPSWHQKPITTGFMLLEILLHLKYHLGQINYHRRMI